MGKQPTSLVCDGLKMCCLDKQCGSPIIAVIVLLMHINKVTKTALQRQCVRLLAITMRKVSRQNTFFQMSGQKNNLRALVKIKAKKTLRDINIEMKLSITALVISLDLNGFRDHMKLVMFAKPLRFQY